MREIDLAQEPNQTLSVVLDGQRWDITLKVGQSMMFIDLQIDGVYLLRGQRLVADQAVIPYRYLIGPGNFVLTTNNEENPWWEKFGVSQFLIYVSKNEEVLNA